MLNADAPVVISSEVAYEPIPSAPETTDPRVARALGERVLQERAGYVRDHRLVVGYQTERSRMTLGCAADHAIETDRPLRDEVARTEHLSRLVLRIPVHLEA